MNLLRKPEKPTANPAESLKAQTATYGTFRPETSTQGAEAETGYSTIGSQAGRKEIQELKDVDGDGTGDACDLCLGYDGDVQPQICAKADKALTYLAMDGTPPADGGTVPSILTQTSVVQNVITSDTIGKRNVHHITYGQILHENVYYLAL